MFQYLLQSELTDFKRDPKRLLPVLKYAVTLGSCQMLIALDDYAKKNSLNLYEEDKSLLIYVFHQR